MTQLENKTQTIDENAPLVLAYIDDNPKSISVIRTAAARAKEKNARWCVLYVSAMKQDASISDSGAQERSLRLMTLVRQMGGQALQVEAATREQGLRKVLEAEKARLVFCLIGSTENEYWWQKFKQAPWQRAVNIASQYTSVEIVPLGIAYTHIRWAALREARINWRHMGYSLLAVLGAFCVASLLEWMLTPAVFRLNDQNVALLFMIACAFSASRYGLLPSLLASVASFLTVNFYFTVPMNALMIETVTDVINMSLFLGAAVLISLFTSQTRGYAQRIAQREMSTQALFTLYRTASHAFTHQQALEKLQERISRMLNMDVAFFLPMTMNPAKVELASPKKLSLQAEDMKALEACWQEVKTTGLATPDNPGTQWRFEPMVALSKEIGVLGIRPRQKGQLDPWFGRLFAAIADQTASVLEHIELGQSMEATRISEEREKLRSMLLSSVSHDLKTPLAGVIGALSVVQTLGERLDEARRNELMATALQEAHRLSSFITNILDMTRLESGQIQFHEDWDDMQELIKRVIGRQNEWMSNHPLTVQPFIGEVEVCMDIMMTEQVLQNLLDNACKYTPAGTKIEIACRADDEGFFMEIRDHGPGLPNDKLNAAFDKYARLHKEDSQIAGTGLGLAICKAVMDGQGGWITAGNHPQGGAVFTLCLPKWRRRGQQKKQARNYDSKTEKNGAY